MGDSGFALEPAPLSVAACASLADMGSHVVITGTGRAGTSFLVALLTNLGLDTGFETGKMGLFPHARAGLERDIRLGDAPYIVKDPKFCNYVAEVVSDPLISIEHVFIPIRDLSAAAESRRDVTERTVGEYPTDEQDAVREAGVCGGLWETRDPDAQEGVLLTKIYNLVLELSGEHIPVTLLRYPSLANDSEYLYRKLEPLLDGVEWSRFAAVFDQTVQPDWVSTFGENDR